MTYLTDDPADGLVIGSPAAPTSVVVAQAESPAVHRAARDLVADLHKVCDDGRVRLERVDAPAQPLPPDARVVVGTLGVSPLVDAVVASGELDVAPLLDEDGAPLWEGFLIATVGEVVYVVGTDRRGTVFGVYDLCEAMGVSPWWWFADVPVRRRDIVAVRRGTAHADHPSVRYRGVFLNDEEELDAWARAHTSDGTIGPQTYARVFELILRLKGNYLWPAMHVNAFNTDPENGRLADEMGLVIGTSHCDMLLRSNQNEWAPWVEADPDRAGAVYDYSVPGDNRDLLHEYWRQSIRQNAVYEVSWTLGMRGIHDSGFHTAAIDADETLDENARARARVALLGQVVTDQRALLTSELGDRGRDCLQTFVPYKEVLDLYDAGVEVPDDVTIIWADDNFGYMRRFPSAAEQARSGGHGLYYHSSYWSPPSRSYLFLSSTPLTHMKNELRTSWERGIRTLWVDNVGALKPLEQDVEFFLRYAWEVGRETTTADVSAWTAAWVDRTFSGGHGKRVAETLGTWAQVTNVRKVEHLTSGVFSQTAYGDEAARRLARLRVLYDDVTDVHAALPAAERDAFVQLVLLKVHASYLANAQFVHADRSALAHRQGKLQAADHHLAASRAFEGHLRALVRHYNTVMSDGKWDGILTPEAFPPPTTAMHAAGQPALRIGEPDLGVVVWGADDVEPEPVLSFSADGTPVKWIEVFNRGAGTIEYTVTATDGIEVGLTAGSVATEERIEVRVLEPARVPEGSGWVTVHSPTVRATRVVRVVVESPSALVPTSPCFLEADGYVSVPASAADERRAATGSAWVDVPGLGRSEGALVQHRPLAPVGSESSAPSLSYRVHLTTPGAHLLELHRFPSLEATGRLRVAIAVDGLPPVVAESPTTDEHRGVWEAAVVEQVERLLLRLPFLDAGEHTLRVTAVDPWFAFSRLVVYTTPPRRTELGPPTSRRSDAPGHETRDPSPLPDLAPLADVARDVYRVDPADIPPPPQIYVDRHFWDRETTFARNVAVEQRPLDAPSPLSAVGGPKDVLAELAPGPVPEVDGQIAVDVARALLGTVDGWTTPSVDAPSVAWTHTQAETHGRAGLALHVDAVARRWSDAGAAPGLHVAIEADGGTYSVWALVKYDGDHDDALVLAVDGTPQPLSDQFSGGSLFAFGTTQAWVWTEISELSIGPGRHILSVLASKSRLRIARLYLTRSRTRPPLDAEWRITPGRPTAAHEESR